MGKEKTENMWIAGITVILWYSPIGFGWYFLVFIGDGYDICMKWYDIWLYIPKKWRVYGILDEYSRREGACKRN